MTIIASWDKAVVFVTIGAALSLYVILQWEESGAALSCMCKRAECVHKKHGGALTAYVIIHLTVWAESIRGEIIRWKESLTT